MMRACRLRAFVLALPFLVAGAGVQAQEQYPSPDGKHSLPAVVILCPSGVVTAPCTFSGGGGSAGSVTAPGVAGTAAQALQGIPGGVPVPVSTAGIAPSPTSATASSIVLKASPGNFYGASIATGATAGYLMLLDATSAPADGAVTPKACYGLLPASSPFSVSYSTPAVMLVGITLVFSSTGCFTKTASATVFMSGQVQ
jgi:hypothetical protein